MAVWDKPCYTLFGMTAAALRVEWEKGVEHVDQQAAILDSQNMNFQRDVRASCTAKLVSKGSKTSFAKLKSTSTYWS